MKMKKTMAAVLSAALLVSGGLAAMAASTPPAFDSPVISTEQVAPATLSAKMTVTEKITQAGEFSYLVAKEILPEGSQQQPQEIQLNLSEQTFFLDSQTGAAATPENIKVGDVIYATYSSAMTRSIPPQTAAYAIVINLDEKSAPAHFLTAEEVATNADGSVTVTADNGSLLVTIGKDTPVSPYLTKNMVKNTDIVAGSQFFAWYDVVTMSLPGQAHATKAVLLPTPSASTATVNSDVDASDPVTATEAVPYRLSMKATVVEHNTETVDGDMVLTRSYTLKSEDATLGTLIANIDENTLMIDAKTGLPKHDILKKGDEVYLYYGPTMTASEPAQVEAEAILVNLDKDHAPPRLLTVEQVERDLDGSVRLLGDNRGVWVTIGKDTPVEAFKTKNIVKNTDLFIGTTVLAWYDMVAESMPAQATADKITILPAIDSSFQVITGGDIAICEGNVENGVAMVPLRAVAESLGFTVTWDAATESVLLKGDERQTTVKIGSDSYFFSTAIEGMSGMSAPTSLGAPAYEKDGVSYVPAELFNLLGATVSLTGTVMHL